MTISARFLDDLRNRLTLSEIVGKRVRIQRAGREYKGCCPFHNEKTASFYVNDDKQFYYCFGCGAHGDVVGFVMQHDKLSFVEAVESLAALAGLQVPKVTREEREKADREKSLYTLMDDAAKFMERALRDPANRDALDYLKERGVGDEALASFRIGFAPTDGQALRTHLRAMGYTDAQMLEVDLLRPSQKGGQPYAFFRDRVMFPVPDRRGRIVAFGGRVLPEHVRAITGDFKPPKYMNSAETPLFHKGRMLYGEPHARRAASEGQTLVVVEGYLDVVSCFEADFRGALAPMGTALTEDQILTVWNLAPEGARTPVLCFDGDGAGRRAAERAAARVLPLLKADHSVNIAFMPEGEDPDSLIRRHGRKAFEAVLEGAIPLSEFLWRSHTSGRRFDTPELQAGLAAALEQETLKIADRALQNYYREMFRRKLWEAFRSGRQRRNSDSAAALSVPGTGVKVCRPLSGSEALSYRILLTAVVNHPSLLDSVEDEFLALDLRDPDMERLRQALLDLAAGGGELDGEKVRAHLSQSGLEETLDKVVSDSIYIHAGFARPGSEPGKVLEGWKDICGLLHRRSVRLEARQAGALLAGEFTEENERRVRAFHGVDRAGEG